jgi:hypothetical protein
MFASFALILYLNSTRVDASIIYFDSMKLCEKARVQSEKHFYDKGFTNVTGLCVQTKESKTEA